ncbi:hypothetical protein ABZS76_32860 [Streptomyces sp. NPDC005562]|uniref:hypothetical protein n=1 Tax=Streptomyces sp. NPDC005562 TaxID=3154890 RepID=UPI0033A2E546
MATKISKTMGNKLVEALADGNHEVIGARTNTWRAMIGHGLASHQPLKTPILDGRGHRVRSHGVVLTERGVAEAQRLAEEQAPAAAKPATPAPVKVRRGDLVMVELRSSYTIGATYERAETLEFKLMTVTNLTRAGEIKMVRDDRYGPGGYPVKFEGMLYRTGRYFLLPAADWDVAEAQRIAAGHTYPNSTTPRCWDSLEAARAALAPARRSSAAPVAPKPVEAQQAPASAPVKPVLPEVPEAAVPRSMMDAVAFLGGLKVGDRVRVTREGRTADLTVSWGPRRADGALGSVESTRVTVSYGVGRYSFEVSAGDLFAQRAGKSTTYGGTRMMLLPAEEPQEWVPVAREEGGKRPEELKSVIADVVVNPYLSSWRQAVVTADGHEGAWKSVAPSVVVPMLAGELSRGGALDRGASGALRLTRANGGVLVLRPTPCEEAQGAAPAPVGAAVTPVGTAGRSEGRGGGWWGGAVLEAEPLNVVAEFPAEVRGRLAEIMSVGPADADEEALLALGGLVSDALHTGAVDFPEHDALVKEISDARMTLV